MTNINRDMGEAFGFHRLGDDEALMPPITITNVAGGFHASDFNHMRETVRLAKRHGVTIGAHPSLPDLQGFGRREMKIAREEMANCIIYEIDALEGFLDAEGTALNHIKPHGSLYGMAARQPHIAHAVCNAADIFKVPLLGMIGMIGTLHETIYAERGHSLMFEFYADLDRDDNRGLIVTRRPEAKDAQIAAARCLAAVREGMAPTTGGNTIRVRADSRPRTWCSSGSRPRPAEAAGRSGARTGAGWPSVILRWLRVATLNATGDPPRTNASHAP